MSLRNRARKPPPRNPDWIVNIGRHRPPPQMGRQLIAPVGRFASMASRGLKLAASTEAGLAVAAGGLAYGLGEHAVEAYKHHQTAEKFRKEGYTEIRAKPRPSDPTQNSQRAAAHTTSHVHGQARPPEHHQPSSPEPVAHTTSHGQARPPEHPQPASPEPVAQQTPAYTKVISNGEQTFHPPNSEAPPAPLGTPPKRQRVAHRHQGQQLISKGTQGMPPPTQEAPAAPAEAPAHEQSIAPSTVVIKPFHIGDKPYNLVQWEANTHEIAEKMMSGLS